MCRRTAFGPPAADLALCPLAGVDLPRRELPSNGDGKCRGGISPHQQVDLGIVESSGAQRGQEAPEDGLVAPKRAAAWRADLVPAGILRDEHVVEQSGVAQARDAVDVAVER